MKHVVFAAALGLGTGCLTSDQFTAAVVTQADATVDPTKPDAQATVHMTLSLIGGDRDHVAFLDAVTLGTLGASLGDLALTFPTPTVDMPAKTIVEVQLVAGDIPNRTFADRCETTMPVMASISYQDTENLEARTPIGELAVFCP